MSVLPIVTYDDEVLRKKAEPIKEFGPELKQLIDDMFDTMYNSDGVGLAAPQIGKLLRIFVANADPMYEDEEDKRGPVAMINPEITFQSDREVDMDEGCLSIPGVNSTVSRPEKIVVSYRDRHFEERELEIDGWWARVIQHEADHLDGILFLDHLSYFKRKLLSSKLKEIDEGRMEIDYPVVSKKAQAG
ncbi:peptide deformylase [Fodinibius salinus]|uniref:Peptide deformylase n=1 Tax=Fodinibius salinus TaxID=860790 RepID=A0A5D3YFT8_9BACT|nr:peptide deformylase [Fodinibius salinus]